MEFTGLGRKCLSPPSHLTNCLFLRQFWLVADIALELGILFLFECWDYRCQHTQPQDVAMCLEWSSFRCGYRYITLVQHAPLRKPEARALSVSGFPSESSFLAFKIRVILSRTPQCLELLRQTLSTKLLKRHIVMC